MPTVTFRYTVADLTDARRHAYNTLPFVRVVRAAPVVVLLGSLLIGVWLMAQQNWNALAEVWAWLVISGLLVVWMFVADRWVLPASVRKSLARDKGFQGDNTVTWDAEHYTLESTHGQSRWPWNDLARWQESPGGLLLWQSARIYNFLPKRCLTEEQASEIRGHLSVAVGEVGKKRK